MGKEEGFVADFPWFSHKIVSLMQKNVINPSTSTINGCQWRILHFTRLLEDQVLGETLKKRVFGIVNHPKKMQQNRFNVLLCWITNFSNFLSYFGFAKKTLSLLLVSITLTAPKRGTNGCSQTGRTCTSHSSKFRRPKFWTQAFPKRKSRIIQTFLVIVHGETEKWFCTKKLSL